MALASGIGATLSYDHDRGEEILFGEVQGAYVITTNQPLHVEEKCKSVGIAFAYIGRTGGLSLGSALDVSGEEYEWKIPLADLRAAHEGFFPELMGADSALA